MTEPMAEARQALLLASMEYLLEVRQGQLAEAVSEASRRGDLEWGRRLRTEIDRVSSLMQAVRSEREQPTGPGTPP